MAKEVVNALRFYHYKEQVFDDSLSALVFDNYFKSLDGNRGVLFERGRGAFQALALPVGRRTEKRRCAVCVRRIQPLYPNGVDERITYALAIAEKPFDYNAPTKPTCSTARTDRGSVPAPIWTRTGTKK